LRVVTDPNMPDIVFPTSAGTAPGYLAVPAAERGPATIVLHEWWGLDDHIRSVCDRLTTEGFFALAPDLYRGEATAQPSEAEQKMMALSMDQAEQDMRGAAEFLTSQPGVEGPGVGAVGFCLGGGLSLWAAATCPQIVAAVTYYYVMPHGKPDFTGIKGPVLGHFGTADAFISLKDAKALEAELRAAGVDVTFDKYTGAGHAFFNDTDRLGTYDAHAALRSWERTVSFLRAALSTPCT
jgi:carboxymethylenebutenolidase